MTAFSKHKETMTRYLEAVSSGELTRVLALFAREAVVHSPTQGGPKKPQEFYPALLEKTKGTVFRAKSFFHGEPPGTAAVLFDYCKPDAPPFDCVDIFAFDAQGKIKELWIIFDTKKLAQS
jgi:hypothetical protein